MASVQSFSNSPAVFPDNSKSAEGHVFTFSDGVAKSYAAAPAEPATAFTVVNNSKNELLGSIKWVGSINSGATPGTFTVPPDGGVSMDFASTNLALGTSDVILQVTLEAVDVTGDGEISANYAAASTSVKAGRVYINFASN